MMHLLPRYLALAFTAMFIVACGGEQDAEAPPSPAVPPESTTGVYEAQATLGETTVPARFELQKADQAFRGRLTLMLGTPVHFALRLRQYQGGRMYFAASSPATGLIASLDGDSLNGSISLAGGRVARIGGTRVSGEDVSADFDEAFDLIPFSPGVISAEDRGEAFPSFTPGGDTLYLSAFDGDFGFQTVMYSRRVGGRWTPPEIAFFSGQFSDRSPIVAPDGSQLVFASLRPLPGDTAASSNYNLWRMTRSPDGSWDEPHPLASLNSDASDYQPSVTMDGTIYFVSERDGGLGGQDVYSADVLNGEHGSVTNMGPPVNTPESEMSSFVAPDGSYIIFSSSAVHEGHRGNDDLYVSYRRDDGWATPRNLGIPVNSFANEYGPTVSPDGKYLYFTSDRHPPANIYRVEWTTPAAD